MNKVIIKIVVAISLIFAIFALSACVTKSPKLDIDLARFNLEYHGYKCDEDILTDEYSSFFSAERSLYAEKGNDKIMIIKFDSKESAKMFYQYDLDYVADKINHEFYLYLLENYYEQLVEAEEKDWVENAISDIEVNKLTIGYHGEYVWFGTEKAIVESRN